MRLLANLFAPFGGAGELARATYPDAGMLREAWEGLLPLRAWIRRAWYLSGLFWRSFWPGHARRLACPGLWRPYALTPGGAADTDSRLYLTGVTLACPPRRRWDTRATVVASQTSDALGPVQGCLRRPVSPT